MSENHTAKNVAKHLRDLADAIENHHDEMSIQSAECSIYGGVVAKELRPDSTGWQELLPTNEKVIILCLNCNEARAIQIVKSSKEYGPSTN